MSRALRLIPVAVLALSTVASTACATGYAYGNQGRYGDRRGYYDYRRSERVAHANGFREGLHQGERDGRRNRRFEPQRHDEWRDADNGFRRDYGDRNVYRRGYRSGFEAGYAQGFRRFDDNRRR